MGKVIGRTTSRSLAGVFTDAADTAMAFIRVGGFLLLWEDRSKRARPTTIDAKVFLGKESSDG